MEIDDVSDCDETYYIMIVRQFLSEENRHERVGVGTINAELRSMYPRNVLMES
jgi:hypothetical protein